MTEVNQRKTREKQGKTAHRRTENQQFKPHTAPTPESVQGGKLQIVPPWVKHYVQYFTVTKNKSQAKPKSKCIIYLTLYQFFI